MADTPEAGPAQPVRRARLPSSRVSTANVSTTRVPTIRQPALPKWSRAFLAELAATSNVSAAARKAKIATATAYDLRRVHGEFNRRWQEALCEGYDHLELELLHRLRTGEVKPPAGAKKGVRSFDNATAFRLLSIHRETVARQRAVQNNQDADAIILSINAKLEAMRQRQLARNTGVIDDAGPE